MAQDAGIRSSYMRWLIEGNHALQPLMVRLVNFVWRDAAGVSERVTCFVSLFNRLY
jgi:hypothetical protein